MPMTNSKFHTAAAGAFAGILVFAGIVVAQDTGTKTTTVDHADQKFAIQAAEDGMAEVQLGNLAKDKASSDNVKQFAQKMVDQHTKANEQLKSIASQESITLPTTIGSKNQSEIDRLSKLSGADFDHAYMKYMLTDHKKDVSEFKKEAYNGKDSNLKKFASDTLPELQQHLQMAQDTANQVGSGSANRSK